MGFEDWTGSGDNGEELNSRVELQLASLQTAGHLIPF